MALVGCLLLALFFALFGRGSTEPQVPAIYVFGDSTADVGNNNYLADSDVIPKANYPHYGIDFPNHRATGRFSNGYNGIDYLAINMGFKRSPPPFLALTPTNSHRILKGLGGVNFASGGSGILDSTGSTITMAQQIQYFSALQSKITARMGTVTTKYLLSRSIFLISAGGNDLTSYDSSTSTPEQFITTLMSTFMKHLEALYNLGARKFALINIPPVGCTPYVRATNPTGACNNDLNDLALGVNEAAKVLMRSLYLSMDQMKYSIGSSYVVISTILENPNVFEDIEVKMACCGSGKLNAQTRCNPNSTYCTDRSHYLFWDILHPTQATAKKASLAFYSGSLYYASPINFMQLVYDYGYESGELMASSK